MAQPPDPSKVTPHPAYEAPDIERPSSASPAEDDLHKQAAGRTAHDPYAAFRYPGFATYMFGWVLSVIGQQLQSAAISYEIYNRTGRTLSLAWIALVQALPVIVLALPAGQLADLLDRRRILIVTQCVACLASLGLTLLSAQQGAIPLIYLVLLIGSTASALGWPARSALLPQIVPEASFSNAITWNSSMFQVAAVIGQAITGFVILKHAWPAYLIDSLCAAGFAVSLMSLKFQFPAPKREPATLQSVAAGVKFVWATKIVLATITLDLFAVLLGGATYLMPVFARDVLHVGAIGYGGLRAAPAVGAFCMGMLIAHLPPMRRAGVTMLWAVTGFGVATILFGLSGHYWLSLAMLFLVGAFDNISVVVRHTLVQVLTPENMRGRVSAVNNVFVGASNELGGFESSVTAFLFGPIISVVGGGIGTILVVLAVAGIWPQVKAFGSLHDAHAEEPTPEPTIA